MHAKNHHNVPLDRMHAFRKTLGYPLYLPQERTMEPPLRLRFSK